MKTFCLLLTSAFCAWGQSALTNDTIVKMVKGDLGESLIINLIQSQSGTYSLGTDDLIALKQQGVSDKIIVAMMAKTPAAASLSPSTSAAKSAAQPDDKSKGGFRGALQRFNESLNRAQQQREAAINGTVPPPPAAQSPVPANLPNSVNSTPTRPAAAPTADSSVPNNTFFVTWRDPRENAFTVGVPQGWTVTGGLIRASQLEPHAVVRLQSPDGKIQIFYDDPELHAFQELDQLSASIGIREGQTVRSPNGTPVQIARYLTGAQFSQQYIQAKMCRQPMITDSGELRGPSQEMTAIVQQYGARVGAISQAHVGEASFRCGGSNGYVFANTAFVRIPSSGANIWFVYQLTGYQVSDPQQSGFAYYVMNTLLETLKMNPQWEAQFAQQANQVNGNVLQQQQQMAQSIAQYGARQASQASAGGLNHPNSGNLPTDLRKKWASEDKSRQADSDARLGSTWVHSSSGTNVRVDNSASNWWRDSSGNVVAGPGSGAPPSNGGQWEHLTPGWQ